MKIKRLWGRWKGFYKLTCIDCEERFYCRDKNEQRDESCLYKFLYFFGKHCKDHIDESVMINETEYEPNLEEWSNDGEGALIYHNRLEYTKTIFEIKFCPYCGKRVCKPDD